jgi:pilus assembly protein CpaB
MRRAQITILTLALAAGGFAAFLMTRVEQAPVAPNPPAPKIATADILVAKTDIESGMKLAADKLEWRQWPESAINSEYIRKDSLDLTEINASMARTPFSMGEPIMRTKLIGPNGSGYMAALVRRGMRAVSTKIETPEQGVAGFILPNDHVDVILTQTRKTGSKDEITSETVLANVRVLAIDQTAEEKNGKFILGKAATLEVTEAQAETLALARVLARGEGTLSLALRSYRDREPGDNETVTDILSPPESITIIRGPSFETQLVPLSKRRSQPLATASSQTSAVSGGMQTP